MEGLPATGVAGFSSKKINDHGVVERYHNVRVLPAHALVACNAVSIARILSFRIWSRFFKMIRLKNSVLKTKSHLCKRGVPDT